ncbi:hypothetical protein BH09MYX1_BH09MYX1_64320 [soil metagenome]
MKKKNLAWIVGGGALVAGTTIFLAACSDDPKLPITGVDSGKDSTVLTDAGSDAKQNLDATTPDSGVDAASCFSKLRPMPEAGPFCYFIPQGGDGGNGINCGTGETCCYGQPKGGDAGFDPSYCIADAASACPAPTVSLIPGDSFECAEKDDCPTSQICCIIPGTTADGGSTTLNQGIDKFKCTYMTGEKGTRCRATCGTGELQGCQSDTECNGKTCTLVNVGAGDRLQMGYCK